MSLFGSSSSSSSRGSGFGSFLWWLQNSTIYRESDDRWSYKPFAQWLTGPRMDALTFCNGIGTSPTSITEGNELDWMHWIISNYLQSDSVLIVDDCSTTPWSIEKICLSFDSILIIFVAVLSVPLFSVFVVSAVLAMSLLYLQLN